MSAFEPYRRSEGFAGLHREMGRLLANLGPASPWFARVGAPYPALNLYDLGDEFVVRVELPGTSLDQLELSITGDALVIQGERKPAEWVNPESYRRRERGSGRWRRTVTLPEPVRSQACSAEYVSGILTIRIPKAEQTETRRIPVTVSQSPVNGAGPID